MQYFEAGVSGVGQTRQDGGKSRRFCKRQHLRIFELNFQGICRF